MVQVMAQNHFEPFGPKPLLQQGDIDPHVAQWEQGAYLKFVFLFSLTGISCLVTVVMEAACVTKGDPGPGGPALGPDFGPR